MATPTLPPGPMPDPAMVQGIIEAYADGIRTAFSYLLPTIIFGAILIPLCIMLFAVSTTQTRRKPIFLLNVAQILLGLATGIAMAHYTIEAILSPFVTHTVENFAVSALFMWTPWMTEVVLLFRVVVIFRTAQRRISRMALILALPVIFKTTRAIINILVLIDWWNTRNSSTGGNQFGTAESLETWMPKVSWILELIDNGYVSFLFLWRLNGQAHLFDGRKIGRIHTESSTGSPMSKMKTLFWIASTNFCLPPIFLLLQIILAFSRKAPLLLASINVIYIYISIISTVLATIWSSTRSYKQTETASTDIEMHPPTSVKHLPTPLRLERSAALGSVDSLPNDHPGSLMSK
ncbi:hypothetical protein C8J56DRAFT_1084759 [Mycena floridula]|nr:hypothetical protein C8J56DRAFT_1084759 [Mycena floridula]